jgi:hypothetical protein
MGILLDAREIVTCAHVIDEALGKGWQRRSSEPGRVSICFPLADGAPCVEGTVDDRRWFPPGMTGRGEPSDIAFIQLDEDAPTSAERAALKNHSNSEAKAYGFRGKEVDGGWLSHPYGDWVYGRIAGTLPGGRMQFDGVNREGATVERGYSGAGVYVQDSDSVVGMIVEKDREKNTAQFIDVPSLKKARGRQAASPRAARREAPPALVASARKKKTELEEYLRAVGAALPEPDPDAGLLPYLEPILKKDDEPAHTLRAAFGFPRAVTVSRSIYNLAAGSEPSMRPLLGILAQRLNHLLWRFEFTLEVIPEEWAAEYMARSQALKAICEPHLVAKQPTLRDVSAALRLTKDLKAFTESAPDPILYAVLRSFSSSEEPLPQGDGSDSLSDEDVALDFLFDYLSRLLDGQWQIDDSSNAWWAVRTGIWAGDPRFRGLLTRVANKYYDITVPREDVSRLAAVPEIYKPIRTSSYTLSNAQAIVEHEVALDDALKEQLRQVIYRMRERLSNTPHSKQLYLASVHHEGFRNYLDYVADQEQEVGGADSAGGAGVTAEK